jgi:hypothetical protein
MSEESPNSSRRRHAAGDGTVSGARAETKAEPPKTKFDAAVDEWAAAVFEVLDALEGKVGATDVPPNGAPASSGAPTAVLHEGADAKPAANSEGECGPRSLIGVTVIAGESAEDVRKLADRLFEEERPQTLLGHILAETIIDSHLHGHRLRELRRCLWNGEIASSILRQADEIKAANSLTNVEPNGTQPYDPLPWLPNSNIIEESMRRWLRISKRETFAAVSGAREEIRLVEAKLGRRAVGLNPHMDFASLLASEVLLSRLDAAVMSTLLRAARELRKERKRHERKTKADLAQAAFTSAAGSPDASPLPSVLEQISLGMNRGGFPRHCY